MCHPVRFGYFDAFWKRASSCVKVILQFLFEISVEKVILVICSPDALFSLTDEAIFTEKVGGIFQGSGKGIVLWMKNSLLTVEPDIVAQMIMAPGSPFESTKSQTSYRDDFSRPRYTTQSLDPDGTDRQEQTGRSNMRFSQHEMCYGRDAPWKDRTLQQSQGFVPSQITLPPSVTRFTAHFNSKGELLLLKTRLRHGKLSYDPKDIDILYPGFQVPCHIEKSLYEKHLHTSEAVVKIVKDPKSSEVRWSVDPKSKGFFSKKSKEAPLSQSREHREPISIATNETVVLETRVRYGEVSMKKNDLEFIYPHWDIPQYFVEGLKRDYHATPDGKLFVISDVEGNLRLIVETDIKDRAMNFVKKTEKKFTD